MINEVSSKIVNILELNNMLKEDKKIYLYSARLFVSSLIGTFFILIIGLISNHLIEAILFECIFSSSRSIIGGYHCKSYISCIMTYVSLFVLCLFFSHIYQIPNVFIIIIEIVTLILVSIFSPVQNINKDISNKKRELFKKYSLFYIIIYSLGLNILLYVNININFYMYVLVVIQIMMIGGVIDYKKVKR